MLLPDLLRKLENLVRTGTIAEVRHELPGALVRVRTGNNVTDWRPYHELRAGNTRTWNPPTVGEQVTLLSPGGDLAGALVIGGIHQNDHPAPSTDPHKGVTVYPDGATVSYDRAAHAPAITLPGAGTADITVPDCITVTCKTADVTSSDSATVYARRVTRRTQDHCQRQPAGAEDADGHAGNDGARRRAGGRA
ncbi:MAG: phage baseplate assembly protein V [Pseudacidovorax sp.]|nr:phage baseplate assembly protein V [Pseudacidovorax sp.]